MPPKMNCIKRGTLPLELLLGLPLVNDVSLQFGSQRAVLDTLPELIARLSWCGMGMDEP